MKVLFFRHDGIEVEYGWKDRAPIEGDVIHADGSDPKFPKDTYVVETTTFVVGVRGPYALMVVLADPDPNELVQPPPWLTERFQ